ncbi:ThuA domain-containing protein [Seongchinamella unica]|uniref:ThuA domain-containing protein n=1 Tax=Seongchinamella unica TaxID=2547392 RepID=A0A4R5LPG1_9GAMM|nr:ThuA domain-containing protein [Seongchinamella unica]TDG12216.1 ThuA domain-containing protein [Seongchinamella unica]
MVKIISRLLLVLVLLLALVLAGVWYIGAWNLIVPNHSHDTAAPVIPGEVSEPAILVFTKTNGFRHKDGIAGGLVALRQIAGKRDWSLYATENGAVFNREQLSRFAAVVFLNTTGDTLNAEQEQAFQVWLESGGGWLGIHAAGDGSHSDWDWYLEKLIGARFTAHILGPQTQQATVVSEQPESPLLAGLPPQWQHEEEWYSWEQSPRGNGFDVLAVVDESSYTPVQKLLWKEYDLRMGDHPVVWSNCVGEGKTLYSAMGHWGSAFAQPQHLRLLENGLAWLIDRSADCR